jgi:hypothetical protein
VNLNLPGEKAGGALTAFLAQHSGVVTVVPASEPLWPVNETAAAIRIDRQERQVLTGAVWLFLISLGLTYFMAPPGPGCGFAWPRGAAVLSPG